MGLLGSRSMRVFKHLFSLSAAFGASLLFVATCLANDSLPEQPRSERIVSLAPSLTEMVFALDSGSLLVGVTTYCDYPEEAKSITPIGGFIDPNLETIVALQPTLVLALTDHQLVTSRLRTLGISVLEFPQHDIKDILGSIQALGNRLARKSQATQLVTNMRSKIEAIEQAIQGSARPKVIVSVGGHAGMHSIDSVFIAGTKTFFEDVLTRAGGINAYQGRTADFVKLSAESLLSLNPDVIIDVVPSNTDAERLRAERLRAWSKLSSLNAVKNGSVVVLTEEFVVNPGPRILQSLELFAKALHPDRFPPETERSGF